VCRGHERDLGKSVLAHHCNTTPPQSSTVSAISEETEK
jgi:hypothetical protein